MPFLLFYNINGIKREMKLSTTDEPDHSKTKEKQKQSLVLNEIKRRMTRLFTCRISGVKE